MESLQTFGGQLQDFFTLERLSSIIRLLVWLLVGLPGLFSLSRWLRRSFTRRYSPQHGLIISKAVLYVGLVIIAFSVLNELGFKISHLLTAAGIVGLAIGFASQTSVSNIISGLFLLLEQPFVVDDIITVGGLTGQVLSIDMLSIKLRTFDNKFVRIPNETIIKSEVTNITRFPIRRLDVMVGVAYKEDIARVRKILLDIAYKNPLCLQEPEPLVIFSGFGSSSIDLQFSVWAARADWLKLKNTIQEEIKARFDAEGIEIPFPHLSIYRGSATEPFPITIVDTRQAPEEIAHSAESA